MSGLSHAILFGCKIKYSLLTLVHRFKCKQRVVHYSPYMLHWNNSLKHREMWFYITLCVKCGFTHTSHAEIRLFTPSDIKFCTILVRKTFSWWVWLHHTTSLRLVLQTNTRQKKFYRTHIVMYYLADIRKCGHAHVCARILLTLWSPHFSSYSMDSKFNTRGFFTSLITNLSSKFKN